MPTFSTKIFNKYFIINFLFSALIVSFILGNLILNLNVLLLILTSFFFFGRKIFNLKFDVFDKVLIFLFIYILLNGILNTLLYNNETLDKDYSVFFKTIFFLIFLILFLVVKFLIIENIINFKIFFITAFICVTFVSADIIFQLIFGHDIFGFVAADRRLSGPFGDELIAGSFIQRFSLISLFLFPIFFKFKKKNIRNISTIIFIFLFLISLVLSGNRIPLLFFIITISLITIFEKQLRKFFLFFVIGTVSIILLIINSNSSYHSHVISFAEKSAQILLPFSSKNLVTSEIEKTKGYNQFYTIDFQGKRYLLQNSYLKEFKTGYLTWQDKKIIGGGVKSFKLNCPRAKILNCGSHPHNYYLEILASLGLIGFLIFFYLFYLIFTKIFLKKYFFKSSLNTFHLITPFFFLFLAEIFPIKSTGSFFSTGNATYIFLILSIIIALKKKFD
mgnify:CR=1 FL=1